MSNEDFPEGNSQELNPELQPDQPITEQPIVEPEAPRTPNVGGAPDLPSQPSSTGSPGQQTTPNYYGTPQQPQNPYGNQPPPNVYPPPPMQYGQPTPYPPQGYLPSANGGLILGLGILSICLCCIGYIMGPVVWIMGNKSLAAIDSGQANPYERGNVVAGRVCAIIGTVIGSLFLLRILFALIIFMTVMSAGNHTITSPAAQPSGSGPSIHHNP